MAWLSLKHGTYLESLAVVNKFVTGLLNEDIAWRLDIYNILSKTQPFYRLILKNENSGLTK